MERKKVIRYFSSLQFLLYASTSLWGYCIIYFRSLGFSSSEIGFMNAAGTGLSMVLLPLVGILGDRLRSPRSILLWALAALLPLKLLLPVAGSLLGRSFLPFAVLSALNIFAVRVAIAMVDAWAGEAMNRLQVPYGNIRRFGSSGYICLSLLASFLMGRVFPEWIACILMPVLGVPLLLLVAGPAGRTLASRVRRGRPEKGGALLSMVLRNYYFRTYLLLVLAFDAFLAIVDLDMSYIMDFIGAEQSDVGIVGAVRASTEVAVMALMALVVRRCRRIPPLWMLLAASGFLVAAEHLLYPSLTGLGGMLAVTLCSGVAGGFFYGFGPNHVFEIVDHRAAATAMAILGVVQSLVGILGASFGGVLIDHYGVTSLTSIVGSLALFLSVLFVLFSVLGRYVWKIPYVSEQAAVGGE